MKTSSLHRRIAGMLVYGALALPGASAFAQTFYNFNWNLAGDDGIAPLQVFDDGQRVYLQFPQGAEVPAVFADTPAGLILLTPDIRQPYTVVSGLETKLSFRLQNRTARAWRAAPDRALAPLMPGNPAPEAVATGLAVPVSRGELAAPVTLNGSAQAPASAASIAVRHGSSLHATPATAAPAATVPPPAVETPMAAEYRRITLERPGAAPVAPAAPAVSVRTVDVSVCPSAAASVQAPAVPAVMAPASEPLAIPAPVRWEARAGMRLSELITQWADKEGWSVRWDTRLDYPIEAAFSVEADSFLKAANSVFAAYQGAQEPFSVTAYANNVLIVKGLKK